MTIGKSKIKASQELEKISGPLTISRLLKAERYCAKITQVVLAKKLGITRKHLSDIENERVLPSLDFAEKAAKKLGDHPLSWKKILQKQLKRAKGKKSVYVTLPIAQYLQTLPK